jgi:hypothetical protein
MGRLLLLTLALASCAPSGTRVVSGDAHSELACATCHQGGVADQGLASVPAATCGTAACHDDHGPRRIITATFAFQHRDHGSGDNVVEVGCAGCHTHGPDAGPLTAGVDACALCHGDALDGDVAEDCSLCHEHPDHLASTSQGVEFPHDDLVWIERSCVRCHFDVARPVEDVPAARCASCHLDVEDAMASGIAQDLHPDHQGISCVSCHASDVHEIGAMSSAVQLDCQDCHRSLDDTVHIEADVATEDCSDCHETTHADQQRLLLGLSLPGGIEAGPAKKFMDGLTCRSCHVETEEASPSVAIRGSRVSCTGCHHPVYTRVAGWWSEGANYRMTVARRYLDAAESALAGAPDTARTLLAESRELLDLVAAAGASHNLLLSHRIFDASLERTASAYRLTGRRAPAIPDLGRRPEGRCTSCHYRPNDPWSVRMMPQPFHEEVVFNR